MEAIFLLAGLGSRISKLTKNPKCLLKINNEEIILRNLRLLKKYKIKNITIVLGYRKMVIKKTLMKPQYRALFSYFARSCTVPQLGALYTNIMHTLYSLLNL